jgi:hypothetical protein
MLRFLHAKFAGLLLACAAGPAIAQAPPEWGTQIVFDTRESFTTTVENLTNEVGDRRFWFETSGALGIRVHLHDGYGDADLIVRKDSPDGTYLCGRFTVGPDELCEFWDPAPGKYFIEVISDKPYQQVRLSTSVLPHMASTIFNIPDEPYQFVRRTEYFDPVPDYVECLEARVDAYAPVRSLSGSRCLPMGGSQQWRLVQASMPGTYRLRNSNNLCLYPEQATKGARIVERNCDGTLAGEWEFLGFDGSTNYTLIVNRSVFLCMDIQPGHGPAVMADCFPSSKDLKAWRLRKDDERAKAQPTFGGVLRNKDGFCINDTFNWGLLGTCDASSPNSRYTFAPAYTIGSGDKWSGQFVIHPNGDKTLCVTVVDWNDGLQYAKIVGCDPTDAGQRWRTQASLAGVQFHNMRTARCLNSQNGVSAADTWLVTTACGNAVPTSIWRWDWN